MIRVVFCNHYFTSRCVRQDLPIVKFGKFCFSGFLGWNRSYLPKMALLKRHCLLHEGLSQQFSKIYDFVKIIAKLYFHYCVTSLLLLSLLFLSDISIMALLKRQSLLHEGLMQQFSKIFDFVKIPANCLYKHLGI